MFPMTVTVSNINQLNAVIAALGMPEEAPAKPVADTVFAKSPTEALANAEKAKAAKAAPKTEAPAKQEAPAAEPTPAAAPAPEASAPTDTAPSYEDVKKLVLKMSSEKGREPTVALLGTFGVAKAPDLKPEQFADVIAALNAALAG